MTRGQFTHRWGWGPAVACAALAFALVGCNTNRGAGNAGQPNGPQERVAGEREEASSEVRQVMSATGLPENFAFGGRIWRGHQVHRVEKDEVSMTPPAK